MSHPLFAELPFQAKFKYPLPEDGHTYIKTHVNGAIRDDGTGTHYPINPGVLVEVIDETPFDLTTAVYTEEEWHELENEYGHWVDDLEISQWD